VLEGIQDRPIEVCEIAFIPSGHGETMKASRCGHHGVLTQGIGTAAHQAGIFAKTRCIHGQDL
jgi:hypothetical protein